MRNIKLFKPYVSWYAVWNTMKVLRSGQLAEGPQVKAFEKEFGEIFGLRNVAAVNSGTAALELAYELANIGEGDEVITPVLTCTATNLPLVHRGATIVFADTARDLNVDVDDIKRKITPKTKAIVFVHFGGNNRGLKELLELCEEKNIILIEDAAQAIGSDFWGRADFTCVSLQAIKALTTGDGGIIICKDDVLDKKARRLRWFGYDRDLKQKLGDTDLLEAGYKYQMNDIAGAIGRGNLKMIDKIIAHQKKLKQAYEEGGITAYTWFACILVPRREELRAYLKERGIDSGTHHYRNDKYSVFGASDYEAIIPGKYPIMDELEPQYLLLPLHMDVSVDDVHRITATIKEFYALSKS